jgi:hypothetical protein
MLCVGLCYTVGPIVGGLLSKYSLRLPLILASMFFALNVVAAYRFMTEPGKQGAPPPVITPSSSTTPTTASSSPMASAAPASFFSGTTPVPSPSSVTAAIAATIPAELPHQRSVTKIRRKKKMSTAQLLRLPYESLRAMSVLLGEVRQSPLLLRVLTVQFLSNAALLMIQSVMLQHMKDAFAITARGNGMVLGYIGILGVLINWIGLQKLIKWLGGEDNTLIFCFVVGGGGCLLGGFTTSLFYFMVCITGISIGMFHQRAFVLQPDLTPGG